LEETRPDSRTGWSWSWGSLPVKSSEPIVSTIPKIPDLPTVIESPINKQPEDISILIPPNPPLTPDFRPTDIRIENENNPGKEMIFPKLDDVIYIPESDGILISACNFKSIRTLGSQVSNFLFTVFCNVLVASSRII
jgi:hypothetical protein